MKAWNTLSSRTPVKNRWITVNSDSVELANGTIIDDYYTVRVTDSVAIVALDTDNNIILKQEYRYAAHDSLVEIPGGMIDETDNDPLFAARRELAEETGYTADEWIDLGISLADPTRIIGCTHLFLALGCVKSQSPQPDSTEVLEVLTMPFKQAVQLVCNGHICAALSAHAILKAALHASVTQEC